jgi:glycine/D-amino acid oxidase-like deaminating enzyme
MTRRLVAVLGAGIMGSATALHLARLGCRVMLFDRADAPFCGASRWNEGKIHLGFLYAGDSTMSTARAVVTGGLEFKDQVASLTASTLDGAITPVDDLFLIHRASVIPVDEAASYYAAVAELVGAHPSSRRYLADASNARVKVLSPRELGVLAERDSIVAGFRVPERSVDTNRVADAFVAALNAESRIQLRTATHVSAVTPAVDSDDAWFVDTTNGREGPFDAVVNALWDGRPAVDRSAGHVPDESPHHRFRVSLFVETANAVERPSAVVAVGAFGDVKYYGTGRFYCSWYDAGLLAAGDGIEPPTVPVLDGSTRQQIAVRIFDALGALLPWVRDIEAAASEVRVEGGWVYSQGGGSLADPVAAVHRRNRLGISRRGSYFSVDTGKYSVAPTMAEHLARAIVAA